ncbi:MAG: PTS sugar transporter subunit IIA [Selenomonadaceae bacterium]|nr:PTS sugar transporter subunit IIA [Selenomonadaceae bacterium]
MDNDFFSRNLIDSALPAEDSESAIRNVGQMLLGAGYVNKAYIESVLEREENFPTGLQLADTALAIPHATPEGNVVKDGIAVAKLQKPVKFHSMEDPDQTVEAEFVFLLALKDSGQHLEVLKEMFSAFQNATVIRSLKDSKEPQDIFKVMEENFRKKQAN